MLRVLLASMAVGVVGAVVSVPVASVLFDTALLENDRVFVEQIGWVDTPERLVAVETRAQPGGLLWRSQSIGPLPEGIPRTDAWVWIMPHEDPRPPMARLRPGSGERLISYLEIGWPMRAVRGRLVTEDGVSPRRRTEWLANIDLGLWSTMVPLLPMPLGMVSNVLFYGGAAAIAWVLVRLWNRLGPRRRQAQARDER